jgi:hypothetical protein
MALRIWTLILAMAASAGACRPSESVNLRAEKRVTLRGVARDAKGGAVLVTLDNQVVYLEGLSSWPGEVVGKSVTATGRLVEKKYLPDPQDPSGTLRQGAWGSQSVLERPVWKLVTGP